MALLWFDGFDHYGLDETKLTEGPYDQADAAFTLSEVNPRTGSRCLRRSNTSNSAKLTKSFDSGKDTIATGVAFYIDQLPNLSNSYEILNIGDSSSESQIILFLGINGELYVTLGDKSTIIATSKNNVIVQDKYSHVEIAVKADSGVELIQTVGGIQDLQYFGDNISPAEVDSMVDCFVGNGDQSLYILDNIPNVVYQYDLQTIGDITTATYSGNSFSTQAQVGSSNNHSITFSNDGTKMYVTEATIAPFTTYQYSLSTAWDISTASDTLKSFNGGGDKYAVQFSNDGDIMVAVDDFSKLLIEYSLSTSWDISTASATGETFDISNELEDAHNFRFNTSGTKLYILGFLGNTIYQYELASGYSISTASYSGFLFPADQTTETHGFCFNSDITKAYVADFSANTMFQYSFPLIIQDSDGILELRVNGVTEISGSNFKTRSNNDDNYHNVSLSLGSSFGHGVTTDVDDWFIWDDSGTWNNTFLGDRRAFLLPPNQDTNLADFEPNDGSFGYKMIDDDSPDDDSTFILAEADLLSGSPTSGTSEFEIENAAPGVSAISAVRVVARAAKTDETSADLSTSINSGSNSVSSATHTLTTSYQYYSDVYEYDPSTIANLTRDGFNAVSVSVTAEDLDPGEESPGEESPGEEIAVPWGSRAVFGGGFTSVAVNTIDYVEIATPGNAVDFGDLTQARHSVYGTSGG